MKKKKKKQTSIELKKKRSEKAIDFLESEDLCNRSNRSYHYVRREWAEV